MKLFYASVTENVADSEDEERHCWGKSLEEAVWWIRSLGGPDGCVAEIRELERPTDPTLLVQLLNGSHRVTEGEVVGHFRYREGEWRDETVTEQVDRNPHEGVFVALPDGAFLCSMCIPATLDLEDEDLDVWSEESRGWTGPVVCRDCKRSIPVIVDATKRAPTHADYVVAFRDAARKLDAAWPLNAQMAGDTRYPFEKSFDDLLTDIELWCLEAVLDESEQGVAKAKAGLAESDS